MLRKLTNILVMSIVMPFIWMFIYGERTVDKLELYDIVFIAIWAGLTIYLLREGCRKAQLQVARDI